MFNKQELIARLQDEEYARMIAAMIDEFYTHGRAVTVVNLVKDPQIQDMIECVMEHASDYPDRGQTCVTGFILGVYLAQKDLAILPSNVH